MVVGRGYREAVRTAVIVVAVGAMRMRPMRVRPMHMRAGAV
jgi:hypothetical protein